MVRIIIFMRNKVKGLVIFYNGALPKKTQATTLKIKIMGLFCLRATIVHRYYPLINLKIRFNRQIVLFYSKF